MKRSKPPTSVKSEQNWGKILKDQNLPKPEQRRLPLSTPKQKTQTTPNRAHPPQMLSQTKSVQQSRNIRPMTNKPVTRDARDVRKTNSGHSFAVSKKKEYLSSNSDLSVGGESIELVERGVQYSTTNLENLDPLTMDEINNGGENGLAFLNPVRTLNFLIRELRGKISESTQDENLARIISDMENTAGRLSKSNGTKDTSNSLISKEDLKFFLNILQRTEKDMDIDKGSQELQKKLEEACNKLEDMCRVMEKTAITKQKEEKQNLLSELAKTKESLAAAEKEIKRLGKLDAELKEEKQKNEEVKRKIHDMKVKFSSLNTVLNEQLLEVKDENKKLQKEVKYLFLEKEKNSVLMKVKDKEIDKLRASLEEIKTLIKSQLRTFQREEMNDVCIAVDQNKTLKPVDMLNDISVLTWSDEGCLVADRANRDLKKVARCSSPVTSISPAAEDDESWRRISHLHPVDVKTDGIKKSVKNLFEEMRKQSKLRLSLSTQNLPTTDDKCANNWINLPVADDKSANNWFDKINFDINSSNMLTLTDTESN
ncbi:uncharacterized protein LOC111058504 [Nilaparvata lugens]|uniref:uncharacterized protein LOC111058504 n=1 Tax=Nilaparvata lugens TaxID=108931 RepID=UPI00193CF1C7|nr:uncharacterized protein LOC111058504 [Nilaparvata lugens]